MNNLKNRFQKLIRGMRRTPLVLMVGGTSLLFAFLMIPGIGRIYDLTGRNLLNEPLLEAGMEKIHDGVWPWQALSASSGNAGGGDTVLAAGISGKDAVSVSDSASAAGPATAASAGTASAGKSAGAAGETASDNSAASTDGSRADSSADGVTGSPAAEPAGGSADGQAGSSANDQADNRASGISGNAEEVSTEDSGEVSAGAQESGQTETSGQEDAAARAQKESNPTYIHADSMPDGVCDAVVTAKDYGIADSTYLSPEDTQYNTDTEGIFAQNGDYYKFTDVEDSYLGDALFLGNSRTEGLHGFTTLQNTAYFASLEGLSVYNFWDKRINYYEPGAGAASRTMDEVLSSRTFRKIYIGLGVNELGIGTTEKYYATYREILTKIREYQPDAIIFIEGMMHVSAKLSSSNSVFTNTIVVQRNNAASTLANGHDIFYIDMNSAFCDENGDLSADATGDGIHLYASQYEKWHSFLLTRGIVRNAEDENGG